MIVLAYLAATVVLFVASVVMYYGVCSWMKVDPAIASPIPQVLSLLLLSATILTLFALWERHHPCPDPEPTTVEVVQ